MGRRLLRAPERPCHSHMAEITPTPDDVPAESDSFALHITSVLLSSWFPECDCQADEGLLQVCLLLSEAKRHQLPV